MPFCEKFLRIFREVGHGCLLFRMLQQSPHSSKQPTDTIERRTVNSAICAHYTNYTPLLYDVIRERKTIQWTE